MKNADISVRIIPASEIYEQIEKNSTVFASAEGYIDIFKFPKQIMKPFLQSVINIYALITFYHHLASSPENKSDL